jgi:hypothetical protein
MARIRTIKPEMWTDERLTECSLSTRLMFIGLLNFADDNGNMTYSAKRIKMQIFPADNIDTQPMIDELLTHGMLIEYSVNGEKFLNIKGFKKHQLINRPSKTSIPEPNFSEHSLNTHGVLTDGMEGNGRERSNTPLPPDGGGEDFEKPENQPKTENSNPEKQKKEVEPSGFAEFWNTWPTNDRKQAKGKCLAAWKKASAERDAAKVCAHVEGLKGSRDWQKNGGEFIPAPLVYLNQKRWEGADSLASSNSESSMFAGAI